MKDFPLILDTVETADPKAGEKLLPLVYDELRRLAARTMSMESSGHTLQPTALVHEAWLRLVSSRQAWQNRAHFFGAAAEAMRRILVEHARRKQCLKRGGGAPASEIEDDSLVLAVTPDEILAVHEALEKLEREDPPAAQLVKLRYFVGMTMDEASSSLGLGKRTAENLWTYARVWLHREIRQQP